MSDFSAKQLQELVNATHTLQRLYYHKEKWPKLFPLISLLAEQYDNAYLDHPRAMQAQLMFYISKQGFTTNLVINQTILCCIISHALCIPIAMRQRLIACCLIHLICAQKESNQLANNEPLTAQGKKLWAQRNLLAAKLMQTGRVKAPIIYQVLKYLPDAHRHLAGHTAQYALDQPTCIVALSEALSRKITLSKSAQAMSLHEAIKCIYVSTKNSYLCSLLKKLTEVLPAILPASCYQQNQQLYLFIDHIHEDRYLSFMLSEQKLTAKGHWYETNALPSQTKFIQKACLDDNLIYSLWFKPLNKRLEHQKPITIDVMQEQPLDDLLAVLARFKHISLEQLILSCEPHSKMSQLLCHYATVRAGQTISELKHAILLLGPARVPEIIKKVALQQQLHSLNYPNQVYLEARLFIASELLEHLAKDHHHNFAEQASCALLKYVLAVLQSSPDLLISPCAQYLSLKGISQLSANSFLLLPTTTEFKLTKDNYLSPSWYKALVELPQIEQLGNNTLSIELSCLIITFATLNRIYANDINPCSLSNSILERAFRVLNLSDCRPSTAFHIYLCDKYNLHPFNLL